MFTRFSAIGAVVALLLVGNACADGRVQLLATDPAPLVADTASGPVAFSIEIADDAGERERGLMFRDDLPENHGMLFVFEQAGDIGFWMKDTPLPLDLVFIDNRGIIGDIRRGEPQSMAIIAPSQPSRFVLELEFGTAARTGLAPGVRLHHPVIDRIAG